MHSLVLRLLHTQTIIQCVIWQKQTEVNKKLKIMNKVYHLNGHGCEGQKVGQVTAKG